MITMKISRITRVFIDRVEGVQIVKYDTTKCHIRVDCGNGESLELILKSEKLEFKEIEGEWITPKAYKGKSMSEEEG